MESGNLLTPPALFQSARNALAAGQLDTALELAQRAAHGDPEDPWYPTLVGLTYTGLGQLVHALAAYEQALLIDPNFSHAHYHQGAIYAHQGRFEQAMHCFRRALAADPTHAPALEGLADAMAAQGRRSEAIDCYRHALSIRNDFFEAHLRLATLLQGAGRYDEAIESAKRALALNPQCVPASLEGTDNEVPESEADAEFRLNPTGRYSHSSRYLRRLAQTDSFSIEQLIREPVRRERGLPVDGWMTVWTADTR